MKELRIHGRGGQGSVVLAELLAIASFKGGKYPLAFPYLGGGGERRGAPVQAFVRIDDKPVGLREKIQTPEYVIIQDTSVMDVVDVFKGIKEGGTIIVNTPDDSFQPERKDLKVYRINADKIAVECIGRPIVNTVLVGAFAKVTGLITIEAIEETIRQKFDEDLVEGNVAAAKKAYETVVL